LHVRHFGDKTTLEQSAKVAKTEGDSIPLKTSTSNPLTGSTPRATSVKKDSYVASTSTQQPADQEADNKQKGIVAKGDKEILANPSNPDKKLWINTGLNPK
jgi:hypothetical protein